MRKNLKKIDHFTVIRIRMYKFLMKHYKSIFRYSSVILLFFLMIVTMKVLECDLLSGNVLTTILTSTFIFIFASIAVVNFFIAYAFAFFRERQLRNLKNMVVIDELTKVYNKRYFLSRLHNEIVRSRRYKHMLSMIIFDIDRFKKLNDTYGHMCGDIILRAVAQIIKGQVRMIDSVCRFGGEEFVVICPETGVHEAKAVAERIRKQIEASKFSYHDKNIGVTISAGVNHFDPLKPKSERTLFSGADKALYVAKNCGRNRVVIFSSLPQELTASLRDVKREDTRLKKRKKKDQLKKDDKQLSF